jgi:phosphoglycerol transferase MdoB-like AlkP superfamily enzyme
LKVSQIQDFKNSKDSESISFKYLKNDTSNKQVLIVIESWGLDKDLYKRKKQLQKLLELESFGYQFQFDSSLFFGGTTSAEVRELYNKSGEAYYSIVQNGYSDATSIPQLKNNRGYNTVSLQSFSGYYSNGYHFRKVAGFNQIKDFSFFKNQSALNFNNHYISVNDEAVFDYGFKLISTQKKAFLYILTINSHLPFHVEGKKSELQSQSDRITEQFAQLANLLKKYPVNKVVIVGDHPPPFFTRKEIDQYSTKFVPAVIITHK